MKKRDAWDQATHAYVEASKKPSSPAAIKGLRTKWLNAKTDYWESVKECWLDIQSNPGTDRQKLADKHEVRLEDIANIDIAQTP